ncbi:MAG: ACP S-malonyltransferase [bacterium]|nr:ACP S-malonyltransferase [bacterium]
MKSKLDVKPDYVAGHSLGEYGAMYSAGVLSFENTLKLIQKRADAMSNVQGGSMAAVLNLDEETIKSVLNSVKGYVAIANYNSLSQIVITGDDEPVKEACDKLLEAGARRVVPLAVSGAFHSSKMRAAADEFMKFEETVEINNAKIPVVTNVDADFTVDSADFKFKMPLQIYSAVKWTQSVQNMIDAGVDTFVEIGNGTVLSGLIRKIDKSVKTYNVYDKNSLEEFVEIYSKELENNVR